MENKGKSPFLESVQRAIQVRHYSMRTEQAYLYWIHYYIRFHRLRHPSELREKEVGECLSWLANSRNVAASIQNQALNALVFMYKNELSVNGVGVI